MTSWVTSPPGLSGSSSCPAVSGCCCPRTSAATRRTHACSGRVGKLTPVDGGYRFSTEVVYSTGCDVFEWFILAGMILGEDGAPTSLPRPVHVVLPREEVEIVRDSWNLMGLQGTGSKRVRAKGVFAPGYRTLEQSRLMTGGYWDAQPGEPLFRIPFVAVFGPSIAHALCGIFRGAQ